jgi:hypothetical protein
MILSTNQPYFAPYSGFFYKAQMSDCLVILDDVQFPRKTTWITRNRFKNDQGTLWMTIPVWKKGLGLQKISDVRICPNGNWCKKHLRSLQNAYANAPYLQDHIGVIERALSHQYDRILDLNLDIIKYVSSYLGIETQMELMSELGVSGKGMSLIIAICKSLNATQFLVQSSAEAYYDRARLASEGIELVSFKKPEYIYPQMWGDFIANLSIFDTLFTCGPKTRAAVL